VSLVVPMRRYECRSPHCQWRGSLRAERFIERNEPTLKLEK
jgi:hypothetical protein